MQWSAWYEDHALVLVSCLTSYVATIRVSTTGATLTISRPELPIPSRVRYALGDPYEGASAHLRDAPMLLMEAALDEVR